MREFFKAFKVFLIIIASMIAIFAAVVISRDLFGQTYKSHSNALTKQRVFDYADKLTDRQEEKLEKLIEKRQNQTGYDIVLVTLNEDLTKWYDKNEKLIKEYGYEADYYESEMSDGPAYKYICVWGNVFWDSNQFGFDGFNKKDYYSGDGVFFVDNWYDEKTWFGTSGDADLIRYYDDNYGERSYHILDLVGDLVVISPYLAYKTYVNTVYYDKVGFLDFNTYVSPGFLVMISVIVSVIFIFYNSSLAKAKNTAGGGTYVKDGPVLNVNSDVFLNKTTIKRHIESSSGGGSHGGGGGHHGGGGHSHGGHGGGH